MFVKSIVLLSFTALLFENSRCEEATGLVNRYNWAYIDFVWPPKTDYGQAVFNRSYVKENIAITSIRQWRNIIFFALPRWKQGVPVTLASLKSDDNPTLLNAFPSWERQIVSRGCSSFQSVTAIEVDSRDRLWVLDEGKDNCPPKLIIIDLNNNQFVSQSDLPIPSANAKLWNMVVDLEGGEYAYISNSHPNEPGILVYNFNTKSWTRTWHSTMNPDPDFTKFIVGNIDGKYGISAIALSPTANGDRFLYYSPLSSYKVYKVSTKSLKSNANNSYLLQVDTVGRIPSPASSMTIPNDGKFKGNIFFSFVENHAVSMYDWQAKRFEIGQRNILNDGKFIQYPMSLSIAPGGVLLILNSRIHPLDRNPVDISKANFMVYLLDLNEIKNSANNLQVQFLSVVALIVLTFF